MKKHLSVPLLIIIYIIVTGILLCAFAYFHHINPIEDDGTIDEYVEPVEPASSSPSIVVTDPGPSAAPSAAPATPSAAPTAQDVPEEDPYFLRPEETPILTDELYVTDKVRVEMKTVNDGDAVFHIADIRLKDVTDLKTYGANGGSFKGSWKNRTAVTIMASEVNAFVATNGDQYGARTEGVAVRNGVLVREKTYRDVAILYKDGRLVTVPQSQFNVSMIKSSDVWQAWSFGPCLLDENGHATTKFNSDVKGNNPRTALGMIEPLHYLLVTVDGRSKKSAGISCADLSKWFEKQGCTSAYNMDGGATSQMAVRGVLYNNPSGDRAATDIIYVGIE